MFYKILKQLMQENDCTQSYLAKQIGVSQVAISKWLNKKSEPTAEMLIELAEFFNCSIDYLLGRSDDFGNINLKAPDLSDEEQELINLFRESSPGERSAVLTLLRRRKSDSLTKYGG